MCTASGFVLCFQCSVLIFWFSSAPWFLPVAFGHMTRLAGPITAVHSSGHLLHQVSQLLRLWTWIPSRSYTVTMQSYHSKLEIMTENVLNAGLLLLLYTLLFCEIAEGTLNIDKHRSVMLLQNFYTVILKCKFLKKLLHFIAFFYVLKVHLISIIKVIHIIQSGPTAAIDSPKSSTINK